MDGLSSSVPLREGGLLDKSSNRSIEKTPDPVIFSVASKVADANLSQYDKWTWKWDKHTEDMWVSKRVDINIKDCSVAQSRVPPSPLPPYPASPMVDVVLTDVGKKKLATLSTQHTKKRVALILEDKLLSVPIIIEPMLDGKMSFSVDTLAEAQKIANRINELISEERDR